MYLIMTSRLASLTYMVDRFKVPEEPLELKTLFIEFKEASQTACFELEAKLANNVITTVNLDNSDIVDSTTHVNKKSIPVYKWNIKYYGVKTFIERIVELSKAMSFLEYFFESATDLFEGHALI